MISAEDSQSISRLEFANKVKTGMVLELSIVLRQKGALQDNKEKCPRCQKINLNCAKTNGWIEWNVPIHFCPC